MSWFRGPIKDVAVGIYDGPHATPPEASEGAVFLGIKNVTPEGRLDFSDIRFVSEEHFPKWTRRVTPSRDDIVFTYEATLHRYALIPEGFRGCLGRRMALIRPVKSLVYPRFLHYYFLSFAWRKRVESILISGATVDRVPLTKFPDLEIELPHPKIQRDIANILSTYDDLIENNRRRMELLEQSARLLFKEWFVHLRFPGHEHTKIVDGVPEGWERKHIDEVCDTIGGGTPATSRPEFWDGGDVRWVIPTDVTRNDCLALLDTEKRITEQGLKFSSAKMLPAETILMTSRASVGFFALMEEPVCTNQGFINVVPHKGYHRMYMLHNLLHRVEEIRSHASGATYKEISKGRFRQLPIVLPEQRLCEEFERQARLFLGQIRLLKKQNVKLAQARDILLPRLMNGEVAV